jgi:hypothetical protein
MQRNIAKKQAECLRILTRRDKDAGDPNGAQNCAPTVAPTLAASSKCFDLIMFRTYSPLKRFAIQ